MLVDDDNGGFYGKRCDEIHVNEWLRGYQFAEFKKKKKKNLNLTHSENMFTVIDCKYIYKLP